MRILAISALIFLYQVPEWQCLRKMVGGITTTNYRPFMVYLVQSPQSLPIYDSWLCAGALISAQQVLTAAACLNDASHLYAIAGTRKYHNGRSIDFNDCTRLRKQRVIKTCVPRANLAMPHNRTGWMTVDIGVATLENPYNLTDNTWRLQCSYIPQPIRVSYANYEADTDAVSFGWGSTTGFRYVCTATDVADPNTDLLQEIDLIIREKKVCKEILWKQKRLKSGQDSDHETLVMIIDRFMYCTLPNDLLDADGVITIPGITFNEGCSSRRKGNGSGCRDEGDKNRSKEDPVNSLPSRRFDEQALCQNDHGAPLIAWDGSEAVLIGVGSFSRVVAGSNKCTPPSFFVSTHCTGKIVNCLIASADSDTRRHCADDIGTNGIVIQDNNIDWGAESEEFNITDSYDD